MSFVLTQSELNFAPRDNLVTGSALLQHNDDDNDDDGRRKTRGNNKTRKPVEHVLIKL